MPEPIRTDYTYNPVWTEPHATFAHSATAYTLTLVGTEHLRTHRWSPMKTHTESKSTSYAESVTTGTTEPQQITRNLESPDHLKSIADISAQMGLFDDPAALARAKQVMPTMAEMREIIARKVKPEVWHDDAEPLF
jgi:hypothetical protein